MEVKYCSRCKKTKPITEFHQEGRSNDGHAHWCKLCMSNYNIGRYNAKKMAIYNAEYKKTHKEEARDYWLRYRYGIDIFEYDEMLEAQGNGCAICGITPEENGKRLFVDHDHETGEVRGLLCSKCNQALGLFQDSPELCRIAELYLQRTEK